MAGLLVSVRSAAEAGIALTGGATLIDVEEPANGPLGRAALATIRAVVAKVAGRRPVSAAMGELVDNRHWTPIPGLSFAKSGLAGCASGVSWKSRLLDLDRSIRASSPACRLVVAAYADWQRADAPHPIDVCEFACTEAMGAFLVDTHGKDGSTLCDWLTLAELGRLRLMTSRAGLPLALAGALGPHEFSSLRELDADWFAVRGAACRGGNRRQRLDLDAVRQLAALAAAPVSLPTSAD